MIRRQLRRHYATLRSVIDAYTSAWTKVSATESLNLLWTAAAPTWLPIETAPTGEYILGYYPSTKTEQPGEVREIFCSSHAESQGKGYFAPGYHNNAPNRSYIAIHPTHWMSLPIGPQEENEKTDPQN